VNEASDLIWNAAQKLQIHKQINGDIYASLKLKVAKLLGITRGNT
jgi:hypothetical protein